MATGYTYKLYEGEQEFSDFVMDCARAFGAYMHLRDEPNAALSKIEDDTPNRIRALDLAQEAYNEFTALTELEQREAHEKYVQESEAYNAKSEVRRTEIAERYGKMLGKVIAWDCPEELTNLKDFMREQLEKSIEFDCKKFNSKALDFDEWRDGQVSYLLRRIERCEDDIESERRRVKEQHAWHEALLKAAKKF